MENLPPCFSNLKLKNMVVDIDENISKSYENSLCFCPITFRNNIVFRLSFG